MTKTIYLAGKMSGLPNFGFEIFDANAAFLRDLGWRVISPADLDRESGFDGEGKNGSECSEDQFLAAMRRDYAALLTCDAIAFLPNWITSRGAKLERDFGAKLGLDFYRVDVDKSYFEKEFILALCGVARAGKDSIAKEFVQNLGFERHGFADPLKDMLYALNPKIEMLNSDFIGHWSIQAIVDQRGWEDAKSEPEIRQLLQRLGTEAGRSVLGENFWVDTLFSTPSGPRLVIPDCRFENEATGVRSRAGKVIRIHRKGVGPVNQHISDAIAFDADFDVHNDGTVKESYLQIVDYLSSVGIDL